MRLEVKGIDALIKKFDNLANDAKEGVQSALNDFADRTATDAKQLVSSQSSDEGALLRSINPTYNEGYVTVTASAKYAAYIEFGTRKFAAEYVGSLPSDWKEYAASFQGSTGATKGDFWKSIKAWGERKGLSPSHIYFTYKKILREGIRPKPFMYPSVIKNLPILIKDIKDIFKQ
jgi:HK97 gp10 family phage protein